MDLEFQDNRPGVWRDVATGLEFERYVRDVPSGYEGLRCYFNGKIICHTEARKLGFRSIDGIMTGEFEVRIEQMRDVFLAYTKHMPETMRVSIGPFEALVERIICGWQTMMTSATFPRGDARIVLRAS